MKHTVETYTIRQLQEGDTTGYRTFFMHVYPRIMAFACRFVDRDTAQDIVQDAFVALWENRHALLTDNLQAYLLRNVQNRCLNYLKHKHVEADYESKVRIAQTRLDYLRQADDGSHIMSRIDRNSLALYLRKAIQALRPETCAKTCELYYFGECSVKEIAQKLNLSVRTVEGHLYNGLNKLRKLFRKPE